MAVGLQTFSKNFSHFFPSPKPHRIQSTQSQHELAPSVCAVSIFHVLNPRKKSSRCCKRISRACLLLLDSAKKKVFARKNSRKVERKKSWELMEKSIKADSSSHWEKLVGKVESGARKQRDTTTIVLALGRKKVASKNKFETWWDYGIKLDGNYFQFYWLFVIWFLQTVINFFFWYFKCFVNVFKLQELNGEAYKFYRCVICQNEYKILKFYLN